MTDEQSQQLADAIVAVEFGELVKSRLDQVEAGGDDVGGGSGPTLMSALGCIRDIRFRYVKKFFNGDFRPVEDYE